VSIVKPARTILSAIALLLAVTSAATASALAGETHRMCVTKQHDCGQTPRITQCCCGDEQASQMESTPVQSRIDVRADLLSMPAVMSVVQVATAPYALIAIHTSPPHRFLIDLPTLFSSFLI